MKTILILLSFLFTFLSCSKEDDSLITDYDGNEYHTVKIGSQTWMVENLSVTHYNDGTPIENLKNVNDWINNDSTGGYCWYNNDESTNKIPYGALYNYKAISDERFCPKGWHVPNDSEWRELIEFLGGDSISAAKLKETGTSHWRFNTGTNESGFKALPGGYRWVDFYNLTFAGFFWSKSSTESVTSMCIITSESTIYKYTYGYGLSVRCLKD
ncbi:MAG TPA: fibrobacter succinogenes major paralogous domain-containing protein [Bacteroidales bacterium]|nr:fibrobacter succinogenes major paralogous domain-containing protein [Bacteroidales bacterium]